MAGLTQSCGPMHLISRRCNTLCSCRAVPSLYQVWRRQPDARHHHVQGLPGAARGTVRQQAHPLRRGADVCVRRTECRSTCWRAPCEMRQALQMWQPGVPGLPACWWCVIWLGGVCQLSSGRGLCRLSMNNLAAARQQLCIGWQALSGGTHSGKSVVCGKTLVQATSSCGGLITHQLAPWMAAGVLLLQSCLLCATVRLECQRIMRPSLADCNCTTWPRSADRWVAQLNHVYIQQTHGQFLPLKIGGSGGGRIPC